MSHQRGRAWLQAVLPVTSATSEDQTVIAARLHLRGLAAAAGADLHGHVEVDLSRRGTQVPGWEHWEGAVAVAGAVGTPAPGTVPAAPIDDRPAAVAADRYDRDAIDLRLLGADIVLSPREYAAAARIAMRRFRGDREALALALTRPGLTVTVIGACAARLVLAS
jgi:hypothetical protein